jgi:hypothetical protein
MKIANDPIGIRNRDIPVISATSEYFIREENYILKANALYVSEFALQITTHTAERKIFQKCI